MQNSSNTLTANQRDGAHSGFTSARPTSQPCMTPGNTPSAAANMHPPALQAPGQGEHLLHCWRLPWPARCVVPPRGHSEPNPVLRLTLERWLQPFVPVLRAPEQRQLCQEQTHVHGIVCTSSTRRSCMHGCVCESAHVWWWCAVERRTHQLLDGAPGCLWCSDVGGSRRSKCVAGTLCELGDCLSTQCEHLMIWERSCKIPGCNVLVDVC